MPPAPNASLYIFLQDANGSALSGSNLLLFAEGGAAATPYDMPPPPMDPAIEPPGENPPYCDCCATPMGGIGATPPPAKDGGNAKAMLFAVDDMEAPNALL